MVLAMEVVAGVAVAVAELRATVAVRIEEPAVLEDFEHVEDVVVLDLVVAGRIEKRRRIRIADGPCPSAPADGHAAVGRVRDVVVLDGDVSGVAAENADTSEVFD